MIFGSSAASQEHALVQGYRTIWRKPTPVARQATRAGVVKTISIRGQTALLTYASAPTLPRRQQPSDRHRRQGEVMPPRLQTPFVRTTRQKRPVPISPTLTQVRRRQRQKRPLPTSLTLTKTKRRQDYKQSWYTAQQPRTKGKWQLSRVAAESIESRRRRKLRSSRDAVHSSSERRQRPRVVAPEIMPSYTITQPYFQG